MSTERGAQAEHFSPKELAYLEYVASQSTLGEIGSRVVALEAELGGIKTELASTKNERTEAEKVFTRSLLNIREAIDNDETLDPLQRYIWSASFGWAAKERSVTASTDLVTFASEFQERVETIQARMVEDAPIIAVGWGGDNTVVGGILNGDKFIVNEDGVKTPAIDGVTAWIGWGRPGEWTRFSSDQVDDLTLFRESWLKGSDPLSEDAGDGLDELRGWDEQPGFARDQRIFMGVDEIKGFLNNHNKGINDRFNGLIAAGFAGVDIASLEEELPEDLLEHRNNVAANIAEAVATNILSDAISESPDDSLRRGAEEHLEYTEMPTAADLLLYLQSIGISSDKLIELVNIQLEQMGKRDFVVKVVIPQVLTGDQITARIAGIFEKPEVTAA